MRINNNSTYVNPSGMQKRCYSFYTNDDAEMKLRHENEWYQRIYWQGVETFNKHGWVIFDTFTYADEHLPRLKDYFDRPLLFSKEKDSNKWNYFGDYGCFNHEHFPKFMKDLRSALKYDGYDVKDSLKYVYTTEYGTERTYQDRRGAARVATLRPHYHLMLFCTDPNLTPAVLNEYIGKLWKYGFHDNGKSPAEFRRNTFTSGMNATDTKVRLRGLANYIGKYMHKSSDYEEVIGRRIKDIAYKVAYPFMKGFTQKTLKADKHRYAVWKEAYKDAYKKAYKRIATFHGQSQHFGEYALVEPDFDIKQVAETGKMRMPDKKKVVKYIPIPMYYRRKLFYEQVEKDDGKLMWRLKDDELSHIFYKNMTYRQSAIQADIYTNVYNSLKLADKIKVDSWMNGRTMNDLAVYEVFFKDCWFDCDLEDIGTEEALEIRLAQDFSSCDVNGNLVNVQDSSGYRQMHYIDQYSRDDWKHFDEVLKVFEPYLDERHVKFNEVFRKKEDLQKIYSTPSKSNN